jgi:DNA-binding winged helix-turn-helix (wHTH) protein
MTDTAIRFPSSRVAARKAIGDSGEKQKLIRTIARKGFRFVGDVREPTSAVSGRTVIVTINER